jgi:hypothetical protein
MLEPSVYQYFMETVVKAPMDATPPQTLPPSKVQILVMYYRYYYHPLFARPFDSTRAVGNYERMIYNLRVARTNKDIVDCQAVVSLAKERDPFLWFMTTLVSTLETLPLSNQEVRELLSYVFSILHDRGITPLDTGNIKLGLFEPQIHKALVGAFADVGREPDTRFRFASSSIAGKRLVEDVKSWQYVGSISGLTHSLRTYFEEEFREENTELLACFADRPTVVKAGLVQLILGLIGLGGDIVIERVHDAPGPILHSEKRYKELCYKRIMKVDANQTLLWTFVRVLYAAGVHFGIEEKMKILVTCYVIVSHRDC